jgi:SAM-dependent methyltransferase
VTHAAIPRPSVHESNWEEAGRGWGARAREWAYLFESYARPANELLFDQLRVTHGTRLLDVACGSGLAANTALRRGATVTGIDASADLISIARARTPNGDFRVGDMFALPFDDDSFDVVTSFNGIWNGCEPALREVRRVLVDGGRFGMTFWGSYEHLGLLPYFLKIIDHSPASHQSATTEIGDTRLVIGEMLNATRFHMLDQGTVDVINEWPDVDTAVRALAAAGPSVPAIAEVGYDTFCLELQQVIAPLYDAATGVRISSEFGWVSAAPHRTAPS